VTSRSDSLSDTTDGEAARDDLAAARCRLKSFLLRHDIRYEGTARRGLPTCAGSRAW